MYDPIRLQMGQLMFDNGGLMRLDRILEYLLVETGLTIPDFDALTDPPADTDDGEPAGSTEPAGSAEPAGAGDGEPVGSGDAGSGVSALVVGSDSGEGMVPVPAGVDLSGIAGVRPHAPADLAARARLEFVEKLYKAVEPRVWSVLGRTLDKSLLSVKRYVMKLLKMHFLLPRLTASVLAKGHGFDRLDLAASRGVEMDPGLWDFYDRCLADLNGHSGPESFRAEVEAAVALLKTPDHDGERAHERRSVQVIDFGDGRSALQMVGPSLEVEALMKRLEGFARTIKIALSGVLEDAETLEGVSLAEAGIDPEAVSLADDRTMTQLMFDMLAAYAPSIGVDVSLTDDPQEDDSQAEDAQAEDTRAVAASEGVGRPVDSDDRASEPASDRANLASLLVHMPRRESWLRSQAQVSVLVPVTNFLGLTELPASMNGVRPLPADAAMRLAAGQSTVYRLLCHPGTGEILDEPAHAYRVGSGLRRALVAKYAWCTFPGCTRLAERCESEHVEPFHHDDPDAGGLSTFANCHVMCRVHHRLKTAGSIRVERTTDGALRYAWTTSGVSGEFSARVSGHGYVMGRIAARELVDAMITGNQTDDDSRDPGENSDQGDNPDQREDSGRSSSDGAGAPGDVGDAGDEDVAGKPGEQPPPLFPLESNWDGLRREDKRLPGIKDLREMLGADGLLPPVPALKLGQETELAVLYRIARARHRAAYHSGGKPAGGVCPVDACVEHAGSVDEWERSACLGVANAIPTLDVEPAPPASGASPTGGNGANTPPTTAPSTSSGTTSPKQPDSPATPKCVYAAVERPVSWRPAGWVDFARHRTLAQILADPWRHDDPLIVTDLADAQHQSQLEWEADQPPF